MRRMANWTQQSLTFRCHISFEVITSSSNKSILCNSLKERDNIRKIFYPDLTTLGCSDPQIRQIACRLPLSALIPTGSPQIHQITLDILDQLEQPKAPNRPISLCSVVWYLDQSNPLCYHTYTPVTLVASFKNRSFYPFYLILLICHATDHHSAYRFQKHSFLLCF